MVVNGKEVPQHIIDIALARMRQSRFTAAEIERIGAVHGLSARDGSAMRFADRLIQREKKAGSIAFVQRDRAWEPSVAGVSA